MRGGGAGRDVSDITIWGGVIFPPLSALFVKVCFRVASLAWCVCVSCVSCVSCVPCLFFACVC